MGDVTQLPPDVRVEAAGVQESRRVVLDIEGTTFELHPEDARAIGYALVKTAADADARELCADAQPVVKDVKRKEALSKSGRTPEEAA